MASKQQCSLYTVVGQHPVFIERPTLRVLENLHYRNSYILNFPPGIIQSSSAQIGPFTVIGNGTTIGDNTRISNSVVGDGCKIGSNVSVEGSYIWHNVTIEDGCTLRHAIVCDGVIIKSGAVLEPGAVVSFKVCNGCTFIPFLNN